MHPLTTQKNSSILAVNELHDAYPPIYASNPYMSTFSQICHVNIQAYHHINHPIDTPALIHLRSDMIER